MPWTAADAEKHHKGLSPAQRRQWAAVANRVLEETGDEGRAIREANAAVNTRRVHHVESRGNKHIFAEY